MLIWRRSTVEPRGWGCERRAHNDFRADFRRIREKAVLRRQEHDVRIALRPVDLRQSNKEKRGIVQKRKRRRIESDRIEESRPQ